MLSRRWLINGALLVVIALLAFAIARVDNGEDDSTEQRISDLRPTEVNRIELSTPELSVVIQRESDSWQILQPVAWPAHADNIERLLSILNQQASAIANVAQVDPAALGLQPPVASWRLNDTQLDFGAINPLGERRYLRIGSKLFLVPDVHLAFATQGLPGLVDRRLLPQQTEISELQLPGIAITRNAEGDYLATQQPQLASAKLAQLVENWHTLPASGIRNFNLDARPGELISVRLANGDEMDFLLQSSDPEIIIANPEIGLQYHFRRDYRDQLIAPDDGG